MNRIILMLSLMTIVVVGVWEQIYPYLSFNLRIKQNSGSAILGENQL